MASILDVLLDLVSMSEIKSEFKPLTSMASTHHKRQTPIKHQRLTGFLSNSHVKNPCASSQSEMIF